MVTKGENESEDYKVALMLHCIGEKTLEIYTSLPGIYAGLPNKGPAEILTALEGYCDSPFLNGFSPKNFIRMRHQA